MELRYQAESEEDLTCFTAPCDNSCVHTFLLAGVLLLTAPALLFPAESVATFRISFCRLWGVRLSFRVAPDAVFLGTFTSHHLPVVPLVSPADLAETAYRHEFSQALPAIPAMTGYLDL